MIGDGDDDALGSFVLRTTSFNTIRTLAARLEYFNAVSGGRLACMPLELKLRGKSTTMSHRTAIYYVDLVVRAGLTLEDAIRDAAARDETRREAGYDQAGLDEAARRGFANGAFEEMEEDVPAVIEEFYPDRDAPKEEASQQSANETLDLGKRLQKKGAQLGVG